MPSTFSGLYLSLRGMQAQQKSLETSAHNIANANTPGFSRQRGVMATTPPWPVPSLNSSNLVGQIGTGVDIVRMERLRDEYLDVQRRKELGTLQQWNIKQDTLEQVEVVFQEPTENGLNSLMTQFWDSWQELSQDPESSAVRTTVKETAAALADALRHTSQQMEDLKGDLDSIIEIKVLDINSLASQISQLNDQIKVAKAAGFEPNDLYDRRDVLLDEVAEVIDFKTEDHGDGAISVMLYNEGAGDYASLLVDGVAGLANTLAVDAVSGMVEWDSYTSTEPAGNLPVAGDDLGVSDSGTQRTISSGELRGLFDSRDNLVQEYIDDLDTFASELIDEVNTIHQTGFGLDGITTGLNFFTGTDASDIVVNPVIDNDPTLIGSASTAAGVPGDGSKALELSNLRQDTTACGGASSFDDFYRNLISRLGVDTAESQRMVENQEALVGQLEERRESISGVSIDEELAHMVEYQHAYQAAARFLSTMDGLLDTLINRMAW